MAHTACPQAGCWRKSSRVVGYTKQGAEIRRCSGGHKFVNDKTNWNNTIYVEKENHARR